MVTEISVLHTTSDLHPRSGGTSRVVVDLTDALARQPHLSITLLAQSNSDEASLESTCERVDRFVAESRSRLTLGLGLPFRHELARVFREKRPALIHNHGLWLPVNYWAMNTARKNHIPSIMQPHGMLEPWALSHKALKKRIALALFQRRDLESAKVMIASTPIEYENIRKRGFRQPIAVIPNGVEMVAAGESIAITPPAHSRERIVLFLSRVHPVKGLLNLIQAWAQVSPRGWRLLIAGPDEGSHLREVMAAVQQLGVGDSVEYVGEVDGARKSAMYQRADLFVLPTFTENFGVVVAEALSHGLPVITTHGAPWADLETHRCGWWVAIGADPLAKALHESMALSDEARREMGARGHQYVRRFDWGGIADQMHAVYRWLLGQGEKPECVITD